MSEEFKNMSMGELVACMVNLTVGFNKELEKVESEQISDAMRECGYDPERLMRSMGEIYLKEKAKIIEAINSYSYILFKGEGK